MELCSKDVDARMCPLWARFIFLLHIAETAAVRESWEVLRIVHAFSALESHAREGLIH